MCILVCVVTGLNITLNSQKPGSTFGVTSCCSRYAMSKEYKVSNLCVMNNRLIYFSRPPKGCKCSPLFLDGNYSNKVTLLLLAGDVQVNPGPGGSSFPCGLCEIDVNWSNGGIACEQHCDVWYHRDCARLNLSSFNRLVYPSRIWICYKCSSKNFSHFPFHYSQLYLTVCKSFDPLSDTNFTFELDSFSSTTPSAPRIHSTTILNSPISLEPPVQNITRTSTQANPPPAFSISSTGPESPPSVLTPELSSDFIYPKKGSNWRTVVINTNSITHKKAVILI